MHITTHHLPIPERLCGAALAWAGTRETTPRRTAPHIKAFNNTQCHSTSSYNTLLHRIAHHRSTTHRTTPMQFTSALVTLTSLSPMTQSRQHDAAKLDGENHDAYDARTWRNKLHVEERDGRRTVVIPATAIHQCLTAAAKYSKKQIPGQGKATWTAKFAAGIMLSENPALNIDPDATTPTIISANADGVRGSGKRVTRRFPTMLSWTSTFEIVILDPIITEPVFREMVGIAGMFVGLGQFRPANQGTNGRFKMTACEWSDNRQLLAA